MTAHSDVVVRVSGSDGAFTDYVVHCVQDLLVDLAAIDRGRGEVTESLISFGYGSYLAVVDNNGVPRYRRWLGTATEDTARFWLRHYRVGSNGDYRWHYTTTPQGGCGTHRVLDEDFTPTATVSSRWPLLCTGVHDFRILDNGNYLLMSYEPAIERNISHITLLPSLITPGADGGTVIRRQRGEIRHSRTTQFTTAEWLRDSAVQILRPSGSVVRTWSSWGAMAYEDCVQHWWDEYAHVNSVQYFEGSVIGSFRGCSKVLSINASTGKVDWRLGRSNLTAEQWAARSIGPAPLRIVGDPEGEFCGQHGAEMRSDGQDGRLTLFDNGEHCLIDLATGDTERTSGGYARALEYALDLANNEALFLRDHSLGGTKSRVGTRGGHVDVLDNGDWLVSWGRSSDADVAADSNTEGPTEAITQVDPRTGAEKLSFDVPTRYSAGARAGQKTPFQANIRATSVPAYVLAPQPVALSAELPDSAQTSLFHKGDNDTPQVLVAFNRPVADFADDSPSLSVTGGAITGVSALIAAGERANAYLITLDPAGEGAVTLRLLANKACADGGICAADGSTLRQGLTTAVTPAPLVSFQRQTSSLAEGSTSNLQVRLSKAHQGAGGVTIPIVVDSGQSTASSDDYQLADQSVTFRRGETSKTVSISALEDTLVEGDETLVFGFGNLPEAIGTGTVSSHTLTVRDRTTAALDFSRYEGELAEGDTASFTLKFTNDAMFAEDATINLAVSGTATPDTDFGLTDASGSTLSAPYSITFPAAAASTSFTLEAKDDSTEERTKETVTIRATLALTNASLGSRTVTIPPSDVAGVPDVTISAGSSVDEGDTASFTLNRPTDAVAASLTVSVRAVASGAALSGSGPSTVTFAAGSATATLSVPTRDDTVVRDAGGQVTAFVLGSGSNPPKYLTTPQNRASVDVSDDDVTDFTLTSSTDRLTEGRSMTLTIDAGGVTFPTAQEIELRLSGTADPGADYRIGSWNGPSPYRVSLPRARSSVRVSLSAAYDRVADSPADNPETIAIDAYRDDAWFGSVDIDVVDGTPPQRTGPIGGPSGGGPSSSGPSGGGSAGGGPSGGGGGGDPEAQVSRSGGTDRYHTSLLVSQRVAEAAGGKLDTVVVVSGLDWADAILAAPLAGSLGAAVLLTPPDGLTDDALKWIGEIGATKAVLVGTAADESDDDAIADSSSIGAAAGLEGAGLSVERIPISGSGVEVARRLGTPGTLGQLGRTAIIATNATFADALAAGPLSAKYGLPLLLTLPDTLDDDLAAYLTETGIDTAVILGGTAAISTSVRTAIADLDITVRSVGGATRFHTAVDLSNFAAANAPGDCFRGDHVGIARAFVPFDSFSAAPLLARLCAPLLLVYPDEVPRVTADRVARIRRSAGETFTIDIFGGTAAITKRTADELEDD